VAKRLGPFDIQMVPKSPKHAKKNKEICFTMLKTNERGLVRKASKLMANKSRSL
jgi:hypothetical protein